MTNKKNQHESSGCNSVNGSGDVHISGKHIDEGKGIIGKQVNITSSKLPEPTETPPTPIVAKPKK